MDTREYIASYLDQTAEIAKGIDKDSAAKMVDILSEIKAKKGRVFFVGVGGGAGTGSHSANDFNKIAGIHTICLTDNASLLTALTNDEGWESVFKRQLEMQNLSGNDCLFIYSVGGGTETLSSNLVLAINLAKERGAKILGVVGKATGVTAKEADACVVVPCPDPARITPHTEDFQMVIDHLLANALCQISK